MEIIDEREMWIHTHFYVDSFYVTPQEQRIISMRVEPELRQMGIQYGLHYINPPSQQRAVLVLECIPFDHVKAIVRNLINETIKDFPSRKREKKNVVTKITTETVAEPVAESTQSSNMTGQMTVR